MSTTNYLLLTTNTCFISLLHLPFPTVPVLKQPARHHLPLVHESAEGCALHGVHPLQMANHQNYPGHTSGDHGGPLHLQYAWLHGQEDAGCLRKPERNRVFNSNSPSHSLQRFIFIHPQ